MAHETRAKKPAGAGPGRPLLLINPNRMKPAVAPLGLDLVAGALADKGVPFHVLDLAFSRAPVKDIQNAVRRLDPLAVAFTIRNIDDCYYASQSFLLPPLRRYVRAVKSRAGAPVILGGVGFSIAPRAALDYLGADIGVRGDGEDVLPKLLAGIAGGREYDGLPGVVLPSRLAPGRPEPKPAADPNYRQRQPRRDALDLLRYFRYGGQGNIETSRGCDRKCVYCADPVAKGTKVRRRNPESVADEMARMLSLGVNVFHLCDCEFNLSRSHAEALALAIIRAGIADKIKWYAYGKPAPMDADLAVLLARAGCAGIDFGADAASEQCLENLGSGHRAEDLETCARAMKKAGIVFMYDLLIGGPGETRKTMAETVRRIKRVAPGRVGVSFGVRVFPGTGLARMIEDQGPLADNPNLEGNTSGNDSMLRPLFYVSREMGDDPEAGLKKMIDGHPAFLFARSNDFAKNYNYNGNRDLCRAIKSGERGAYWDILRRLGE